MTRGFDPAADRPATDERPLTGPAGYLALAARVLFWAYIATVLAAGFWGLVGARLDFPILMGQQVGRLDHQAAANVLSQYRFLRGLEAGFGLFAVAYRRDILGGPSEANRLFLAAMGLGIAGRLVGWAVDGQPRAVMLVFLFTEMAGWACIAASTRPWSRGSPGGRDWGRV